MARFAAFVMVILCLIIGVIATFIAFTKGSIVGGILVGFASVGMIMVVPTGIYNRLKKR